MAKGEVLEQEARAGEQERPENGDEQLEHPCRLQTSAVQTTKRKSLYNQEYGVFARDRPCDPPPASCLADLDGNGNVGASDLLALLANWGPCP